MKKLILLSISLAVVIVIFSKPVIAKIIVYEASGTISKNYLNYDPYVWDGKSFKIIAQINSDEAYFFDDFNIPRTFYETTCDTKVTVGSYDYTSSVTSFFYEKYLNSSQDILSIDVAFKKGLNTLDFSFTLYFPYCYLGIPDLIPPTIKPKQNIDFIDIDSLTAVIAINTVPTYILNVEQFKAIPVSKLIRDILKFYRYSVSNGTLTGTGRNPWLKKLRLNFLKKMLKIANKFIKKEKYNTAYLILKRADLRCDGLLPPRDFVKGPAVSELNDMISDLIEVLRCN